MDIKERPGRKSRVTEVPPSLSLGNSISMDVASKQKGEGWLLPGALEHQ